MVVQHFYPTIYSVSDPHPLAVCTGRNLPSGEAVPPGERTYSDSCTIKVTSLLETNKRNLRSDLSLPRLTFKHGSFGGPGLDNDEYYSAPSDDFRAYVWKLPHLADLGDRRVEFSASEWPTQSPGTVGTLFRPNKSPRSDGLPS
jgi:WD repeat-containing protein 22